MRTTPLGNVCQINPGADKGFSPEECCSFIPMEAVDDKFGIITQRQTRRIMEVSKGYTPFRNRDVLFAKITPCMENGKCAVASGLTNGIGFGSTEFHVLRSGGDILPEWIFYFLRQDGVRREAERNMTGSAGQKRVPAAFLTDLETPLPPLPEQQRLAALLGKADHLRRTRRYAQQLSDTFLQSVFLEMFGDPATNPKGWGVESIDDVLASSQYGTSEKSNQHRQGYPVLGMANVSYSGELLLDDLAYVALPPTEFEKLRLRPGDIIFNRTNSPELIGKVAHWNLTMDAVVASYLVKLCLNKHVLPDYFSALLNSPHYKHLFRERCKKAVNQANLSPTLLREFSVMVPPLPLQQQFAQIVGRVERLRAQQREAARQAEHLFQTLLHRAFRGEA